MTQERRISFQEHPLVTAVMPACVGLLAGCGLAAGLHYVGPALEGSRAAMDDHASLWLLRVVSRPWHAFLLGISVGIPGAIVEVYALRTRFPLFVRRLREGIVPSAVDPVAALAWVPSLAAPVAALGLGWVLWYSPPVAFFGALVPIVMTYSEERRIYRAATKP